MSTHPTATVKAWLCEPLPPDVAQSLERLARADDVQHVAVMPDVHLSSDVCVGVVVATRRLLYPSAVGGDIGCGMAAMRFATDAELLAGEDAAARVLRELYRRVPSLKHHGNSAPAELPACLHDRSLSDPRLEKLKRREGRLQFGTLGRGNHFLEFQADQQNQLWLMLHSGSRAMGQAITAHHVARATARSKPSKLVALDADSAEGQAYLADVTWAIAYAEQNRLAMVTAVCELMQESFGVSAVAQSLIHAHHNHVRREVHFGEPYGRTAKGRSRPPPTRPASFRVRWGLPASTSWGEAARRR